MRGIFRSIAGGLFEKEIEFPQKFAVAEFPFHGHRGYHTVRYRLVAITPESLISDHTYAIFEEVIPDAEAKL